jgi:uncharacterized protein DUF3306
MGRHLTRTESSSPFKGEGKGGGKRLQDALKHQPRGQSVGAAPPSQPSPYEGEGEGNFLHRWSRRKQQAREPDVPEITAPAIAEPAAPAKVLTDADMPPVESLGADSDYSPFMSSGVSEELRHTALRKLFTLPSINQRDPLDGEYYDCHGYLPLGDTVTHEMREEMEREAQKQKEAVASALPEEQETAAAEKIAQPAATETKPAAAPDAALRRHSSHLRKRSKTKRSRA